jgi:hypothetical protein
MTSAFGFDFSARSLAVMTPVESRTHVMSMSGCAFWKPSWYALSWSVSSAV